MEIRRALLLFAVVLGLAAIVTSLARPVRPDERPNDAAEQSQTGAGDAPTATSRPSASPAAVLRFRVGRGKSVTRRLAAGDAGVVVVRVPGPGQVEIESLGISAPADELTPARFDVFGDEPGSHEIESVPADRTQGTRIGLLQVVPSDDA